MSYRSSGDLQIWAGERWGPKSSCCEIRVYSMGDITVIFGYLEDEGAVKYLLFEAGLPHDTKLAVASSRLWLPD